MERRHLLALASPVALMTLGACAGPDDSAGEEGAGGSSDDGADAAASDSGGFDDETDAAASDGGGAEDDPARAALAGMSDREIAGQLVLVGVMAGSTPAATLATEHHVGGYFLLGVWKSAQAVRDAVSAARDAHADGVAPLLAVDQEGGSVRMLRGDAATRTASAEDLGAQGPEAVREAYTTIGQDLAELGLDCALAPVADVVDEALGDGNAPVGELGRGFGTDPDHVAGCVRAAVEALTAHGVAATVKHFPGLGRVAENTDHAADGIIDDATAPGDPMLAPFAEGIDAGAELVMVSSAIYPQIEPEVPAMFSRAAVTDLLRGDMGYDGLVITDDIGSAAAVAHVPVAERITRLLDAGGDAVLTADPAITGELVDAVEAYAAADPAQRERVRESALRILRVKLSPRRE